MGTLAEHGKRGLLGECQHSFVKEGKSSSANLLEFSGWISKRVNEGVWLIYSLSGFLVLSARL